MGTKSKWCACSAVAFLALFLPPVVSAKVFHVNTRADHPPGNCTSSDCTVREAVIAANDASGDDVVRVPAANKPYLRKQLCCGDDAGLVGDLDLAAGQTVKIAGGGAKRTVIDAGAGDRVFQLGTQAQPGGEATISGLTMQNGHATDGGSGGGIQTFGALTLRRVVVRDSETDFSDGGIGLNGGDASLELVKSTVQGNDGGIFWTTEVTGDIRIESSLIRDNIAAFGGGIFAGGGKFFLYNSTVSGNTATEDPPAGAGGGIYLAPALAVADIRAATIAGNIASAGTASNIQNNCCSVGYGIRNTIVAKPFGGGVNCEGQPPISDANNIDDGMTCGFDDATSLELLDAKLAPLDDNGGPTQTRAIKAASPAKNAGDCPTSFARDQRGVLRPRGPECDIGAFERRPSD